MDMKTVITTFLLLVVTASVRSQPSVASVRDYVLVELNCENMFDCRHDEGKSDEEFTPEGARLWTPARYWRKLNAIGKVILSCSDKLPDLVALLEVENDSVLRDLTRRSLLRNAGYDWLMTCSPDERGIDVALLYRPEAFLPLCYDAITVSPLKSMRPTRDILYVKGLLLGGDTLHVYVLHAPSRYGGEQRTVSHRMQTARTLCRSIAALPPGAFVIVAGDFNDYADSPSLMFITAQCSLHNISKNAVGSNGARGTYRFRGYWSSIDHVLVSSPVMPWVDSVYVNDARFLLRRDENYGGMRPFRCFDGYRYQRGYSDHLPLVVRMRKETRKGAPQGKPAGANAGMRR